MGVRNLPGPPRGWGVLVATGPTQARVPLVSGEAPQSPCFEKKHIMSLFRSVSGPSSDVESCVHHFLQEQDPGGPVAESQEQGAPGAHPWYCMDLAQVQRRRLGGQ